MRLLALLAVAQCCLLTQAFLPSAPRSGLPHPLPQIRAKAAYGQRCRPLPVATVVPDDKRGTQLSAVRVIPVSEATTTLWQKIKQRFEVATGFLREYRTFMSGRSDMEEKESAPQQASNATLVTKLREAFSRPAARTAAAAVVSAYLTDLLIANELWGPREAAGTFRPGRLLGIAWQYVATHETSRWLDSKFPQTNVKSMLIKSFLQTILLGAGDSAAVTKFAVTPGSKPVPVPGMRQFVYTFNPLVQFMNFALPLKYRGIVSSTVWSVLSVAWVRNWAKSAPYFSANNLDWQSQTAELF